MKYQEIEGDLVKLALQGNFDVITHGCNCQCVMGAGLAPQMAKAFDCDKFHKEQSCFKGDINKLGTIDYETLYKRKKLSFYQQDFKEYIKHEIKDDGYLSENIIVVNAYTQYMYGTNHTDGVSKPLDYEALTLCLRKINHVFKGKHIGLPAIGCGLAGGIWDYKTDPTITGTAKYDLYEIGIFDDVKTIIQQELKDMNVTIVHFKKIKI